MREPASPQRTVPLVQVPSLEPGALFGRGSRLESALCAYLPGQRWFRSKARRPRSALLRDMLELSAEHELWLAFLEVSFERGDVETYLLPLGLERGSPPPERVVVGARSKGAAVVWVVDASAEPRVAEILHRWAVGEERQQVGSMKSAGVRSAASPAPTGPASALSGEQSNSSFRLGREYTGKLVRKLEPGPSIEVELLEHLGRAPERAPVPELVARVDATVAGSASATIWLSTRYVENVGDAFSTTVQAVVRYYERAFGADSPTLPAVPAPFLPRAALDAPPRVHALFGDHLARVELLATRTAELHRALAHDRTSAPFRPEVPTDDLRRSLDASLHALLERTFQKLEAATLPPVESELRARLVPRRCDLLRRLERAALQPSLAPVLRVHGDYHLGQVLDTGNDFVIVDFDGEPARSREERARKRSPLLDVAGMLRSFHYAAFGVLTGGLPGVPSGLPQHALLPWAALHASWSSAVFLSAYLGAMADTGLLPTTMLASELELHLLEKALYELGYELDARPDWVRLPLRGLLELLGE